MNSAVVLPAVRTIQKGAAVYIASAPFELVGRWRDDRVGPPPGTRARARRVRTLTDGLLSSSSPPLPPLVLLFDGGLRFDPVDHSGGVRGCGLLSLDLTARIRWADDGVHAAAIAEALKRKPGLGSSSLGLVVGLAPPVAPSHPTVGEDGSHASG